MDAYRDGNNVPTLIASSLTDGQTPIRLWADPVTHRLLVDAGGATTAFTNNEVVAGSGTTFTLAATPIAGSQCIYAIGQRLTPTVDYTIAGAVITTISTWNAGDILADYRT